MALTIELSKMQPVNKASVFELPNANPLTALSRRNRDRLEKAVLETYPLKSPADPELIQLIEGYVQNVAFEFLGDWDNPNSYQFMYQLLGGTRLNEFQVFAVKRGGSLTSLHQDLYVDQAQVRPRFAREHGFIMPRFAESQSLLEFFWSWNPESIDLLIARLKDYLPPTVRTRESLIEYAASKSGASLFPETRVRDLLAPLREKLSAFIMNDDDAEHFFHTTLVHYLSFQIMSGTLTLEKMDRLFREPGGVDSLFQCSLFWIQWDGAALHIPLQIPPSELRPANVAETHP